MTGAPLATTAPPMRARRSDLVTGAKVRTSIPLTSCAVKEILPLHGRHSREGGNPYPPRTQSLHTLTMGPPLRALALTHRRFACDLASFRRRWESISDAATRSCMGPRLRGDDGCDAMLAPMRLRGDDASPLTLTPASHRQDNEGGDVSRLLPLFRNPGSSNGCCFWTPPAAFSPRDDGCTRIQLDSI